MFIQREIHMSETLKMAKEMVPVFIPQYKVINTTENGRMTIDTVLVHYRLRPNRMEKKGKGETRWAGTYKGQWFHNLKHGKGVFTYQNGDKYEGDWQKGAKHGSGIYTYATKDRYEGQFESNCMHGIGTLFFTNGDRLTGTWVKDQLDGEALSITANGTKSAQWYHKGQQVSSEAQLKQARQRSKEQEQQQQQTTRPSRPHGELDEMERSRNRGIPRKAIPKESDEGTELMPMSSTSVSSSSSASSVEASSSSSSMSSTSQTS